MNVLGSITLSGLALGAAVELVLATRGSGLFRLHGRDKVGALGIVTGTLWMAAGGAWTSVATGIGGVPTSLLGPGSGIGDPGRGGLSLALTLLIFGAKWKKWMWWVAFLGIAAAVVYRTAGGVWAVPGNLVLRAVAWATGAA